MASERQHAKDSKQKTASRRQQAEDSKQKGSMGENNTTVVEHNTTQNKAYLHRIQYACRRSRKTTRFNEEERCFAAQNENKNKRKEVTTFC
jgi:hypothetical protein